MYKEQSGPIFGDYSLSFTSLDQDEQTTLLTFTCSNVYFIVSLYKKDIALVCCPVYSEPVSALQKCAHRKSKVVVTCFYKYVSSEANTINLLNIFQAKYL